MWVRVVAALFLAWLIAAIVLFVLPRGQKPIHANAVVVLSGSARRLPVGVKLVREGYAPLLVVSRTTPDPTELEQRACSHKLGLRVLCFHARPYSTVGEAEMIGRLARARRWTAVDVVTSRFHLFRAHILVRRCYKGRLRMVGAPDTLSKLPLNMVLESVKLVYHEVLHRSC